jgi:hypothetical protein
VTIFQSLSHKHDTAAIPEQQLHAVGSLRAEHVDHPGVGLCGTPHNRIYVSADIM